EVKLETMSPDFLNTPANGKLVDLMADPQEHEALRDRAGRLPSIQLSERCVCDLEMMATGAFSPLDRFMGQADYQRVLDEMRLASGQLFSIPVTLPAEPGPDIHPGAEVALRNSKN